MKYFATLVLVAALLSIPLVGMAQDKGCYSCYKPCDSKCTYKVCDSKCYYKTCDYPKKYCYPCYYPKKCCRPCYQPKKCHKSCYCKKTCYEPCSYKYVCRDACGRLCYKRKGKSLWTKLIEWDKEFEEAYW